MCGKEHAGGDQHAAEESSGFEQLNRIILQQVPTELDRRVFKIGFLRDHGGQPDTGHRFNKGPDLPDLPILQFQLAECHYCRLDFCGKAEKSLNPMFCQILTRSSSHFYVIILSGSESQISLSLLGFAVR